MGARSEMTTPNTKHTPGAIALESMKTLATWTHGRDRLATHAGLADLRALIARCDALERDLDMALSQAAMHDRDSANWCERASALESDLARVTALAENMAKALEWSMRSHQDALAARPHAADECLCCGEAALAAWQGRDK